MAALLEPLHYFELFVAEPFLKQRAQRKEEAFVGHRLMRVVGKQFVGSVLEQAVLAFGKEAVLVEHLAGLHNVEAAVESSQLIDLGATRPSS